MNAVDHVLAAGATARLARLVAQDSILDDVRLKFVRTMDSSGHPKLAELAVCQWCVSVWIGGLVVLAGSRKVPGYRLITAALTYSMVAGILGDLAAERE